MANSTIKLKLAYHFSYKLIFESLNVNKFKTLIILITRRSGFKFFYVELLISIIEVILFLFKSILGDLQVKQNLQVQYKFLISNVKPLC